jgi:murein DD-endopeptidase MepM/ murein hydrolase activator NlpD
MPAAPFSQGIESLRGRKDPEAMRAAVREMESLFAYEMVKAMRSASGTSAAGGSGFGGDVYGTLFDMELARLLSAKGLGLQEMLLKGLGRSAYAQKGTESKEVPGNVASAGEGAAPSAAVVPPAARPAAAVSTVPVEPRGGAGPPTRPPRGGSGAKPARAPPRAPAPSAPQGAAPEILSAPHTHGPLEESVPAVSGPEEGGLPIREGGRVSSSFGFRKDPFTGAVKFHHGVDIAAAEGTEVYPAKSGEVVFSGFRPGYGNLVEVDHGDGLVTRYAHNRANRVAAGDRVGPDTVIAEVGSTGRSTGPHLHFEVQYEGRKIPPQAVFAGIPKGRSRPSDKYS